MKIEQDYFNKILQKNYLFEDCPKIAVAVSGGPDSMALVFLLNQWIKKNNGFLVALIINHKMRLESNLESKQVKKYLDTNKIKSVIFNISKQKIIKKNMNEARQNRFEQLLEYCSNNNFFHLFLGHHFDDNIETFLLRKIAGSNFQGLRSMQKKVIKNQVLVLRPLLDLYKSDLIKYNKTKNVFFINDPSNLNIKYTRVAARKFLLENKDYKKKIEEDFHLIETYFPSYIKMIFNIFHKIAIKSNAKSIVIDTNGFLKYDIELQVKIIEIIYRFLKPDNKFLRYKKVINFIDFISTKKMIKANLSGMLVYKETLFIKFIA